MASHTISINSAGDPDPSSLSCNSGDKITWTNNYSLEITDFTLPTCVSPQSSPAPIAAGTTTREFTVNGNVHGTYEYGYSWPSPKRGTRNGTIDTGSR